MFNRRRYKLLKVKILCKIVRLNIQFSGFRKVWVRRKYHNAKIRTSTYKIVEVGTHMCRYSASLSEHAYICCCSPNHICRAVRYLPITEQSGQQVLGRRCSANICLEANMSVPTLRIKCYNNPPQIIGTLTHDSSANDIENIHLKNETICSKNQVCTFQ